MVGLESLCSGPEQSYTFCDKVFNSEMDRLIEESKQNYERMMFKEAVRTSFFEYQAIRDQYRELAVDGMHIDLVKRFIESQTVILSPRCPHTCEHIWVQVLGHHGLVVNASWPVVGLPQERLLRISVYLTEAIHEFRVRAKAFQQVS